MVWIVLAAVALVSLIHTIPVPFLLDDMAGDRSVWHMPRTPPATVYLTFDDGPNPSTTPELLDLLSHEGVPATFFIIDAHVTEDTAPLVTRMAADGHAVALHSGRRWDLLRSPATLARRLTEAADHVEALAGTRPCRAFRPHAGWRSRAMYAALERIDHRLVGWGWMLWDADPFRKRSASRAVARIVPRVRGGDILVRHDGDESAPRAPQTHTVDATRGIVSALRARGFAFGTICGAPSDEEQPPWR
jgi:peptidoglycan/xylan/chitin deacetylase (PgdA/CDA1 family)